MSYKFDKRTTYLILFALFFLLTLVYIVSIYASFGFSCDALYMIPLGRYIRSIGIPHNNVWCLDHSALFVAQQWLYAVILSWFADFGSVGCFVFVVLHLIGWYICYLLFLKEVSVSFWLKSFFFWFIFVFCGISHYFYETRPELITLILLLLEFYFLEKYISGGYDIRYLIILPVLTFVEINLHASMWPMHFFILFVYIFPLHLIFKYVGFDKYFWFKTNDMYKHIDHIFIVSFAMFASLLLNPYGFSNITYVFDAFRSNCFNYVYVSEVQPSLWTSSYTVACLVLIFVMIVAYKAGYLYVSDFLFFSAIIIMGAKNQRNIMFLPVACVVLLKRLLPVISRGFAKFDIFRYFDVAFILFIIIGFSFYISFIYRMSSPGWNKSLVFDPDPAASCSFDMDDIVDYIKSEGGQHSNVFAYFTTGAYLEYRGFDHVFFDTRPELYTSVIGGENMECVRDYRNMVLTAESSDSIKEFLNKYQFDYIVIYPTPAFNVYLSSSDEFKQVMKVKGVYNDDYWLYERVK